MFFSSIMLRICRHKFLVNSCLSKKLGKLSNQIQTALETAKSNEKEIRECILTLGMSS